MDHHTTQMVLNVRFRHLVQGILNKNTGKQNSPKQCTPKKCVSIKFTPFFLSFIS